LEEILVRQVFHKQIFNNLVGDKLRERESEWGCGRVENFPGSGREIDMVETGIGPEVIVRAGSY
jgi:hypothetical protein